MCGYHQKVLLHPRIVEGLMNLRQGRAPVLHALVVPINGKGTPPRFRYAVGLAQRSSSPTLREGTDRSELARIFLMHDAQAIPTLIVLRSEKPR